MARPSPAALVLSAALVGTNLWWAYQALDAGVSYTYLEASYEDNRNALMQVIAIAPELARCVASPEQIISIAGTAAGDASSFEKEGFVWVGRIGLRFGPDGKL